MEPFVNPPSRYNPLFPIPSRPPQSWQGSCIYHKDFVPFTPHPSERHDFRVASYCDLLKNGTQGKGHMKTSLLKSCAIYGFVVKTRSEQKKEIDDRLFYQILLSAQEDSPKNKQSRFIFEKLNIQKISKISLQLSQNISNFQFCCGLQ